MRAQCDCDPVEDLDETPGGYSFSLFGTSVSYVDLHFTSDITLNANLTISNCTFAFDPGVDITVPSGYTLTITSGSVLTAASDEMWNGIDVATGLSGAGVIIINGESIIANAKIGVHIQNVTGNYADFHIYDDVLFCNNFRGMRIDGYNGIHPGTIEETEFCGSNLLAPYLGSLGTGIYITDNKYFGCDISIGNGNVIGTTSGYNSFHNLQYGIQLESSTATIQNNYFYDIETISGNAYGIFGSGIPNEVNVYARIGETGIYPNYSNKFENCNRGIYLKDFYNSEIHSNIFINDIITSSSSVMENAIKIMNCSKIHNITFNKIRNVNNTGIFMIDNGAAIMHINNNFISSNLILSPTVLRRGIGVVNTMVASPDVYIDLNVLDNMAVSIFTLNLYGETLIRGNTIDLSFSAGTWPSRGILAENCPDVLVDVYDPTGTPIPNLITGACSSGCQDEIIGIDLQDCMDFRCYRNVVDNCYPGIRAEGDCTGGNFVCNVLDGCDWGFGLKNLDDPINLGVGASHDIFGGYLFLSGKLPSDNQWTPSTGSTSSWANRTHCFNTIAGEETVGSSLTWYYRDFQNDIDMEPASTLNTASGSSTSIPTGSLINTGGIDPDIVALCGFPMPRVAEEEESFAMMGGSEFADNDSLFYSKMIAHYAEQLSGESTDEIKRHLNEEGAFILLKNYPEAVWETESTEYVSGIMSGSNTDYYHRIFDSIYIRNYEAANELFTAFSPSGIAEQNMYDVITIYLNSIDENGELQISSEDSSALEYIAYQHTLTAGLAVNNARAMLDIIVEFDNVEEEMKQGEFSRTNISFYPNPASDILNIENAGESIVEIYSLEGVLHGSYLIDSNSLISPINIQNLAKGVYILKFVDVNSQITNYLKVVKQ